MSGIIQDAINEKIVLKISQINSLEVYYHLIDVYGVHEADIWLEKIEKYPITTTAGLSGDVFKEAGRVKSKYRIPLGDAIAAAECIVEGGTLVTSDHKDFEKVESAGEIKIYWFR